MKVRVKNIAIVAAALCLCGVIVNSAQTQTGKGNPKIMHATGSFDVKLTPQPITDKDDTRGRMSIDKQFHGDLEGTSKGEMLVASTAVKGSAGYVAIERVEGKLKGRNGSFALQHSATMDRGQPSLSVIVVPDSGTEGLVGLTGKMNIRIEAGGKHYYDFDYTLPE
jgi:hypothetical protein